MCAVADGVVQDRLRQLASAFRISERQSLERMSIGPLEGLE
jgi:hypothetical protein